MAEHHPPGAPSGPRSSRRHPRLARALDALGILGARLGGHLLRRPSEELLGALAAADRPGLRPRSEATASVERAELEVARGRASFNAGQHAEALHHFSQAIALAPESAWAWHGRGDALQLLGQPAGALAAYERAAELAPETALHRAARANPLRSLGRGLEADQALDEAILRDPSLTWMRPEGSSG